MAAVATFMTLSGCSLLVESEGLAGDAVSGGLQDSSVSDAAAEQYPPGADVALEARDESPEAETGAGFCGASTHDFCDDFDTLPLDQKWTEVITEAGTVALSADKAASSPNALRVELQTGAPDYESAAPFQMLTAPSASYHVEASVLVSERGEHGSVELLALIFNPPTGFNAYEVFFGIGDGRYRLMEWAQEAGVGDHTNHSDLATSTSFAAWRRVAIDVTLSPSGSKAVLTLDGQAAGEVELEPAPALGVRVGVGAALVSGIAENWTILVDDVTIDAL